MFTHPVFPIKQTSDKILVTMTPTAGFTVGFNLTFTGSLTIDFKDGGGAEALTSSVEKTHLYAGAGTHIAEIAGDITNITRFIADNCRITGLSNFKTGGLEVLKLQSNLLTGTIDLSLAPFAFAQSTLFLQSNSGLTDINFAPINTGVIWDFEIQSCDITGDLDLSNIAVGGVNSAFWCFSNPNLTDISYKTSGNSYISDFRFYSCDITGTFDLSNVPIGGISAPLFNGYLNSNLTNITFKSSGNTVIDDFKLYSCDLTGTLDLSNVPLKDTIYIYSNPNLIDINYASTGNETFWDLKNNLNALNYVDYTVGGIDLAQNIGDFNFRNNAMSAADVNHTLVDLYSLVSGEGAGGDYTGRIIRADGSNAAPDGTSGGYDGLTAKTNLEGKGFTVVI